MTLSIRPAAAEDIGFVWECRQTLNPGIGRTNTTLESFQTHSAWMIGALAATDRLFLIATDEADRLGYMRADPINNPNVSAWMVSLCLSVGSRGKGLARPVLEAGCSAAIAAGFSPLLADIHETNSASQKVFQTCGFHPLPSDSGYMSDMLEGFDRLIHITLRRNVS